MDALGLARMIPDRLDIFPSHMPRRGEESVPTHSLFDGQLSNNMQGIYY